jgi:hypothetical protein
MKVIPLSISKANAFVNQYHRHNKKTARNGGKFAIGAYDDQLGLIGVAIVGNPLSASFMDGYTVEVLRTCVRPDAPKNVNSFLYSACKRVWQAMGGRRILTYTLKSESGSSLLGAGWIPISEVPPSKPGWNKKDHLHRNHQPVQGLPKVRWESMIAQNETTTQKGG